MSNSITAFFKGRAGVAESVYQYDYGKVLIIDGLSLPATFEVHFTTVSEDDAITVIGQNNRVAIPDSCISIPGTVTAYIYLHTGDNDGETEYVIKFAVIRRARPDYDEDDKSDWESAASQALAMLQNSKKVNTPLDEYNQVDNGTAGQLLRTKGNGATEWVDEGLPTDEQTAEAVSAWLDDHPEATTTVQDGSLTSAKFTDALKLETINDYLTPEMFGAKGDGVTDDTQALQSAISSAKEQEIAVLIKKGSIIKITEAIDLTGGDILKIDGTLLASDCDAIRVLGIRNQICGNGTIKGDDDYIGVLFGGADKTDYSNYNIIEGVNIDSFDTGISLYNDQQNGLTVYFDIITNLNINHCRIGIGFYGFADAILVSKIIFTDCGSNDASGGAIVFKNLDDQYPLDNSISQIFHHSSPNAITLNIEKVSFSQFSGIVCEQGGSSAKSLVITDDTSTGNQFYLTSNVYSYRTIPNDCYKRNVFIDISGDISANRLSLQGNLSVGGNLTFRGSTEIQEMSIRKRYVKTSIAERTDVELLQVNKLALNYPVVFKVRCLVSSTVSTVALRKYAEAIILYQGVTSANVQLLDNYGSVDIAVTNDGSVTVNSGDNGTSTTNGFMLLEIEQISDNREKLDLLRYTVGEGFTEM